MQKKYDDLCEVFMKNTRAAMDKNVENAYLQAEIKKLKKGNIELQLENKKFIERLDSLEKDNAKLKDMECENRYLGDVVKFKEDNEDKISNELKESNKNLGLKVKNLLLCNQCDNTLSDKALIFNQVESIHSESSILDFKCDKCDEGFADQMDMKSR